MDGFVDRNAAILTGLPNEIFFLACGVNSFATGSLLGSTDGTNDVTGFLSANVLAEEVIGVDGNEEVTEMVRYLFALLVLAVEGLSVIAVLKSGRQVYAPRSGGPRRS